LVHHGVETITQDPSGAIWFGTWNGISRLNGSIWTSFESGDVGTWVESIAIDSKGATWAGTIAGIARFDPITWAWHTVLAIDGQPEERGVSITFAPDGSLWAGTYNSGIYHFDGETWTNYTLDGNLPSNKVTAIATAPDGTLQVVTHPDRYDQGGGTWQYDGHAWTRVSAEASSVDGDSPSTVTAPDGTVWAIRERGVAHSDGEGWTTYTVKDGLIDDRVTAIAIAADGTIWIATKGGISRYTPQG
jgi:ligand-binding sensor domain-containing protein